MPELALISLGSNLGDRKALLDFAVVALSKTPGLTVRNVSTYHETTPVGGPSGQGAFLNAAAALETTLDPEILLDRLHTIEAEASRVRTLRWGERTLDLDLLLYGDRVIENPRLTVPHPRMVVRRFVLAPLFEIVPHSIEPSTGMTIGSLLDNLDRRPSYVALLCHRESERPIFRRLVDRLSAIGLYSGGVPGTGDHPYGMWRWQNTVEDYLRLLEQAANELHQGRWTERCWGDRWIVTDFWFDRIYGLARLNVHPIAFPVFRERFEELRPRVIAPTMLVVDRRIKIQELNGYFSDENIPVPRNWRTVPTLRPDTDDPDEIASEIVAACQATRSG